MSESSMSRKFVGSCRRWVPGGVGAVALATAAVLSGTTIAVAVPTEGFPASPAGTVVGAARGEGHRSLAMDIGRAAQGAALTDGAQLVDPDRSATAELQIGDGAEPRVSAGNVDGTAALTLDRPCHEADTAQCPKAVLAVEASENLDPGDRDFSYGALLHLEPWQTSTGSNIVQKGFSRGGGGQWKLQVDREDGRPTCVVVGSGSTTITRALSRESVSDGSWHQVTCVREGDELSVLVDGAVTGTSTLPPGTSVDNDFPVRIGAKNDHARDNDQFYGALARVDVELRGD